MSIIRGLIFNLYDHKVYIDGVFIDINKSLRYINHSPDGFNWGYSGSGPSQLAFAILLEIVDIDIAKRYYQQFKNEFIVPLKINTPFKLEIDIQEWIDLCNI